MSTIITTGDDAAVPVQLYKKQGKVKSTFVIDAGATIKAVLTSIDRLTVISAEVIIDNTATGADLATSLVIVELTEAQTEAITLLGDAIVEIQVDDGGKLTWTTGVFIRKGNIA